MNQHGGVTALCFKVLRSIDLGKATWTNRDEAVTCPKCLKAMELRKADHARLTDLESGKADGSAKENT